MENLAAAKGEKTGLDRNRRPGDKSLMTNQPQRFEKAIAGFFAAHHEDPRLVEQEGRTAPWSVFYHERMREWLERIAPEASEELRLAAGCQHIRRWQKPREEYPDGKLGYKKWRHDLAVFHGEQAGAILREAGYGEGAIQRVKDLLLKKDLKSDAETQALEDVICLVFLENELGAFAGKHDEAKIARVLRKTWTKMSMRGHEEALSLVGTLPPRLQHLVQSALE